MDQYEDATVMMDADGLTIKNYRKPRDAKRIKYTSIRSIEVFEMRFWTGRHRLVGISAGRPRNWFAWDRSRNTKNSAISLDVGRWVRPTIVPEDPDTVEEVLRSTIGQR